MPVACTLKRCRADPSAGSGNTLLFLYVAILLLLGMLLDSSSILLIMTPVTAPIAAGLDFNLIHFAIITVIAVEIGLLTRRLVSRYSRSNPPRTIPMCRWRASSPARSPMSQ